MSTQGGHSTRARQALARLPEVDPAIAALSLWCSHRDGAGRTVTEGETIRYGAEFPLLPISEQVGLLAHHVLHVAFRHSARRRSYRERAGPGFRADLYDLACDALVNEALLRGGHALPRPAVRADELIVRLPAQVRPGDVLAEWDCDRLYLALVSTDGTPAAGSVEDYAKSRHFVPDLADAAPETAEPDVWAARVEQGLAAGRSAGAGIGTVLARLADLPRSGVPWEVRLRRLIQRALAHHPRVSHRRPASAWLARDALARSAGGPQPVFEPGRARIDKRPRLVVCVDTSSSITEAELEMFAAEALALVRRTRSDARLLVFDTEVHHRAPLDRRENLSGHAFRRGGGTDYRAVLDEAGALNPSLIVVFTDLEAEIGPAPGAPIVWAVPDPPDQRPAFGEVIALRSNDRLP